jgi:hypothetical protein
VGAPRSFIEALRDSVDRDNDESHMLLICKLPEGHDTNLQRLAEVTFTSLFETYYPPLFRGSMLLWQAAEHDVNQTRSPGGRKFLSAYASAAVSFQTVATKAKETSGWPGFTSRLNSGLSFGHNVESPLMEWLSGLGHEHQLWIQRDTFAPATTDATLYLIATFRRHEVSNISYYDAGRDGMITLRIQAKACIKKGKTCTYRGGSMVIPYVEADGFS